MEQKQYQILKTIEEDVPDNNINWCTISFLTPQNIDKLKFIDVKSFKIHNGYNSYEIANEDASRIKNKIKNHDVFIQQVGKIYNWDDVSKSEIIEYDDKELNLLEKSRKENADKAQLLKQQFENETKRATLSKKKDRLDNIRQRLRERIHKKGHLTKQELDQLNPADNIVDNPDNVKIIEKMNTEIEDTIVENIDYLEENESVALKYACVSIYSPTRIRNLDKLCIKIRGIYENIHQMQDRVKQLAIMYPHDLIYQCEIGKWCCFAEDISIEPPILYQQLNYAMKCYLENVKDEEQAFLNRKKEMMNKTREQNQQTTSENKTSTKSKKRRDRKARAKTNTVVSPPDPDTEFLIDDSLTDADKNTISELYAYLEDPELKNKYAVDTSNLQSVQINN